MIMTQIESLARPNHRTVTEQLVHTVSRLLKINDRKDEYLLILSMLFTLKKSILFY